MPFPIKPPTAALISFAAASKTLVFRLNFQPYFKFTIIGKRGVRHFLSCIVRTLSAGRKMQRSHSLRTDATLRLRPSFSLYPRGRATGAQENLPMRKICRYIKRISSFLWSFPAAFNRLKPFYSYFFLVEIGKFENIFKFYRRQIKSCPSRFPVQIYFQSSRISSAKRTWTH